ncbi:hypothetical protein HG535_0D02260 [Zygotorulaspora mrakii]|uniref:6-phosphofructo-2-kinase domain-containing protein n=1 Tax=Zygotorulaspora mrakii TaxID=42260 RepID=A0A7H9B1J7_ZYGMR|nr:uncharacterized protein HG535_0D02260 [Zygotorulaspora mrakii]QLG72518.1 hypothetical protein HG535_0D02260 [Zygotorulaspora mrakii]
MFKNDIFDTAVPSPSDSECEPTEPLGRGNVNSGGQSESENRTETGPNEDRKSGRGQMKHVRIVVDEDTSGGDEEAYDEDDEDGGEDDGNEGEERTSRLPSLPTFQKRPLSDTPVTSTWNSPSSSADTTPLTSPEASSTNLAQMHRALLRPGATATRGNLSAPMVPTTNNNASNGNIATSTVLPMGATGAISPSKFQHPARRPTTIDVPGLTKSKSSPDGTISREDPGSKLVIVMVGLPATGKSFITNKLSRYLNFSMYYCKVFNVGNTRRQFAKEHGLNDQDSNFFDPKNSKYSKLRDKWALDTLDQLLDYLLEGPGSVGIFDATNTTNERRKVVLETIRKRNAHLKVLFLESVCSNKSVVEKNIQLKLFGPDYKGKDPESSLRDFKERLVNYMKAYEPIEDEENIQFIKMIDVGKKVIAYNIQGFLASQTVYYLLNFNLTERQIWITRNGESEDNVLGRLGGDSNLTRRGENYARALAKFMDFQRAKFYADECEKQHNKIHQNGGVDTNSNDNDTDNNKKNKNDKVKFNNDDDEGYQCNEFFVWTSMRNRSIETAKYFNEEEYPIKQMRMLDELSAGDYEGMTYPEIQDEFPDEFEERRKDKLRYRYPGIGGESYMDVTNRLRPVITEIERIQDNVLIITHRVVARILLGYFMNLNKDIICNVDVPLHCVYCLELKPYGITWALWEYDEVNDRFFKVPQSEMNTTKVKENELVFAERRYSVVPTAPPSASSPSSDSLPKRSSSSRSSSLSRVEEGNESSKTSETKGDIHPTSLTSVPFPPPISSGANLIDGGGTSISTSRQRLAMPLQSHPKPSVLTNNNSENSKLVRSPKKGFEIDQLNEKLSKLKANASENETLKSIDKKITD